MLTRLGAGTEVSDNYSNAKIVFLNIENIHAVRDSYQKMMEAFLVSSIQFQLKIADVLNPLGMSFSD